MSKLLFVCLITLGSKFACAVDGDDELYSSCNWAFVNLFFSIPLAEGECSNVFDEYVSFDCNATGGGELNFYNGSESTDCSSDPIYTQYLESNYYSCNASSSCDYGINFEYGFWNDSMTCSTTASLPALDFYMPEIRHCLSFDSYSELIEADENGILISVFNSSDCSGDDYYIGENITDYCIAYNTTYFNISMFSYADGIRFSEWGATDAVTSGNPATTDMTAMTDTTDTTSTGTSGGSSSTDGSSSTAGATDTSTNSGDDDDDGDESAAYGRRISVVILFVAMAVSHM